MDNSKNIGLGRFYNAIYSEQLVDEYKGNPLIEALPTLFNEEEIVEKLTCIPKYNNDERLLSSDLRYQYVHRLFSYFEPLDHHIDLEKRLSSVMRQGYLSRSPLAPEYAVKLQDGYRIIKSGKYELIDDRRYGSTASGFTIIGISGIGKSRTINRILSLYPQVIVHSQYKDYPLSLYQLTFLKIDCPTDGSIKGLCISFFKEVDKVLNTNYDRIFGNPRNSIDALLPRMAQIASLHCLGLLVIDEIQHLSVAKSGGAEKMLNFFVTLVNTIGVPVILIGTPKALPIVQGDFRQARRSSGQGDMVWNRMKNDDYWDLLTEGMWEYQWTRERVELTPEIKEVLYNESQGIIDIAIKLYVLAQWKAIALGEEVITPESIKSVAMKSLQMVQPMLQALRSGDINKISQYDDIRPISLNELSYHYKSQLAQEHNISNLTRSKGDKKADIYELVEEIIIRLLNVGITPSKAEAAALDVVKNNSEVDLQSATNEALLIALSKDVSKKVNKGSKKYFITDPDDLRVILENARKEEKSGYEGLLNAGYIKSPEEFMDVI